MSDDDKDTQTETTETETTETDKSSTEKPELSEEGKQQVEQMQQAYDDDRETAVLPGTDNTITGVAINEWLDDDGNPKFDKDKEQEDGDSTSEDSTSDDDNPDAAADKQTEDAG